MRAVKGLNKILLAGAIAYALAGVFSTTVATAADQAKGGQKLTELNRIKTVGDIEALKPGDTFAMACAKCETIIVKQVINTAKGAEVLAADGKPTQIIGKHLCPGCGANLDIVGHGKAKEAKITHTCGKCGDASAFCCAGKPGHGVTKGMEEKK